ncbi:MAG: hypothetical protein IPG00_02955 [Saprospiraceae bacterium]|nr:hypothetical protein [Saprospiraceae bacterium]
MTAIKIGLVDKPDHRKNIRITFLWSEDWLLIYIVIVDFSLIGMEHISGSALKLMGGSYVLLVIGAIDDKYDVKALTKLIIH